jgi:hypothetical protein
MFLMIRITFVILCAYAGSVAGGAQFVDSAGSYQSPSE